MAFMEQRHPEALPRLRPGLRQALTRAQTPLLITSSRLTRVDSRARLCRSMYCLEPPLRIIRTSAPLLAQTAANVIRRLLLDSILETVAGSHRASTCRQQQVITATW